MEAFGVGRLPGRKRNFVSVFCLEKEILFMFSVYIYIYIEFMPILIPQL